MSEIKAKEPSLYDSIGGTPVLQRVHKIFYDKVYKHRWISDYFRNINQELIENQQTDFMAAAMGGPQKYAGKFPIPAHKHMFITEDLFIVRHDLLKAALMEAGVPTALAERWLYIDAAFKKGIMKQTPDDCEKRYNTDQILNFPNPDKKAA